MKTIVISLLLLLCGAAVFVLGNPYFSVFPTNGNRTSDFETIAYLWLYADYHIYLDRATGSPLD